MSTEHPTSDHGSSTDDAIQEVRRPFTIKMKAAGKSKRQKGSSDDDDEEDEPSTKATKISPPRTPPPSRSWAIDRFDKKTPDAEYDDAYTRDVPNRLRSLIHREEWEFYLRELSSARLVSRMMQACREMENELAMKTSAGQGAPRSLSDLREFSAVIGAEFGQFVSASFDIGSAFWMNGSKPTKDKALFGKTMGKLLESFINGTPIDLGAIPKLESVSINGMHSAMPPTDVRVAKPSQPTDVSALKRKLSALERRSSFGSTRSYPRSPSDTYLTPNSAKNSAKKPKLNDMTDDELRAQLTEYQTVDCKYDKHGNLGWVGTKNRPGVNLAGIRFVTVPELIKLLLAEPWKAIAERPFAFRMLDEVKYNDSYLAVFGEVKKSIEDVQHLIARWERQFRIQLPSSPEDLQMAYPDEVDRQWIINYRNERSIRATTLLHTRKRLEGVLKDLVDQKKVPKNIDMDPGLMMISEKVIAWMPTTQRLLYDMAIRAARDPSRFNSVFNPATHVFYREHLQYAFPVNPEAPKYDVIGMVAPWPFTDEIIAKYPIDEWRQEAKAEWDFYQRQLHVPLEEPPFPDVEFPRRDEYATQMKSRFKRTRYAYYHSNQFTENPVDKDGNQVQVKKWETKVSGSSSRSRRTQSLCMIVAARMSAHQLTASGLHNLKGDWL